MNELEQPVHVVIVGHVDHGKSTFIGRFLYDTNNLPPDRLADIEKASKEQGRRMEFAFVMDQFQEEREKNITIDTSQTFLKLDGRQYVIIDAPGHKEYLKNMITGATQAHSGILMLDVNEGLKEQTERHARVLKLLGITQLAVMINKMDLVKYDEKVFKKFEEAMRALLGKHGITPEQIVPISAYEGENVARKSDKMPWYKGPTAIEFLKSCKEKKDPGNDGALCFPIQYVHELDGKKILLGRVERGIAQAGTKATLFPSGETVELALVDKFKEKSPATGRGESIAIELKNQPKLARGNILCGAASDAKAVKSFSLHTFWAGEKSGKVGDEVLVECRTQTATCVIKEIADDFEATKSTELKNGDIARVQFEAKDKLLLDKPELNEALSRVVIHKEGMVSGCGVVANVQR